MTNKTLQQIQKENRKIIGKPLTLDQVLIAWAYKIAKLEPSRFDYHKLRFFLLPDHEYLCEWDLTKETLEEQSEDTQKRINDLLNI